MTNVIPMNPENKDKSTLFDPGWYPRSDPNRESSYPLKLEGQWTREDLDVDEETELSVFNHVAEHETEGYEARGYLSGPIEIIAHYTEPTAGSANLVSNASMLPTIADSQYVEITNCRATGLLIVESEVVFDQLMMSPAFQELGLLLITGCGIPRITARRLIRRLHVEHGLRIHLLTDNDTWGYFVYSLLLRGSLAPHAYFPWAAVDDVNYLGIRAGDCEEFNIGDEFRRGWKDIWTRRLNSLRTYECFQAGPWQEELNEFEKQRYAVNLTDFIDAIGSGDSFVTNFIVPRI